MLSYPRQGSFICACRAVWMGAHLDEDARARGDGFAQQLDTEVFRLDEKRITALGSLRANTRPQPLRAVSRLAAGLGDELLRCQASPNGVTQQQITREVEAVNACNEW